MSAPFAYEQQIACDPGVYPGRAPTMGDVARYAKLHKRLGIGGECCDFCSPFADIQAVIHTPEGSWLNPLFDAVKSFTSMVQPNPIVIVGNQTVTTSLVVQAEESHMGDFLVTGLLAQTFPGPLPPIGSPTGRVLVDITNQQNNRQFMNSPVLDRFVFSTSQFGGHTLPCCFFIEATNFAQIRVTAIDPSPVTTLRLGAVGTRFLPYMSPELREQILAYWNQYRTTPFWLTIDRITLSPGVSEIPGGVRIAAGATATVFMTVPGGGDFELKHPMMALYRVAPAFLPVDPSALVLNLTEGVGRSIFSEPVPAAFFFAQANQEAGIIPSAFVGDEFRAASGGHGRWPRQPFKRNSRLRLTLQNTGPSAMDAFVTLGGCMHYYDECPPGPGLQRALSLEPVIGPMLIDAPRCPPLSSFEPEPGRGMVQVGGAMAQRISPTGFVPPVPMPGMPAFTPQQIQQAFAMQQAATLQGLAPGVRMLPDGGVRHPMRGGRW